jgi:hypothetical protein
MSEMTETENLPPVDSQPTPTIDKKAEFTSKVEEAKQLVEELQASGITEQQDLIRELRPRFQAHVISKVLGISGKELAGSRNADKRAEEKARSEVMQVITEKIATLSKSKAEQWMTLGQIVEEEDLEARARKHNPNMTIDEYVTRAFNFFDTYEKFVLKQRLGVILA